MGEAWEDARRRLRLLRYKVRPSTVISAAIVALALVVVCAALSGPRARMAPYRTEPVMRALGLQPEALGTQTASVTTVPSLSVTPRLVLPTMRVESKRVLPVEAVRAQLEPPAPPPPPTARALPPLPVAKALPPPPVAKALPPPPVAKALPPPPVAIPSRPVEEVPPPLPAEKAPPAMSVPLPPPVFEQDAAVPAVPPPVLEQALLPPVLPTLPRTPSPPLLAIVIDDLGPAVEWSRRAIRLPRPVTLAFLPYAAGLDRLVSDARAHGHEIFVHLPMEPTGDDDPGPNAILTGLEPDELRRRLAYAFDRLPQATGFNNHMGSRTTADPASMLKVLEEGKRRGLLFVDSRTTPLSVGMNLADRLGIPNAPRDVFLDNVPVTSAILKQLADAERLARRRGHALAIGHPYPETITVLERWLPEAEARGLKIVRAGELIARQFCTRPAPLTVAACAAGSCAPAKGC